MFRTNCHKKINSESTGGFEGLYNKLKNMCTLVSAKIILWILCIPNQSHRVTSRLFDSHVWWQVQPAGVSTSAGLSKKRRNANANDRKKTLTETSIQTWCRRNPIKFLYSRGWFLLPYLGSFDFDGIYWRSAEDLIVRGNTDMQLNPES